MELTQLIQRAQQALDSGEYQIVASACRHALATYPTCLGAHRLLGEASLEQGQLGEAVEQFAAALTLDPLDVVSSLGLGVAAEESGDVETAYSFYLQAWELNPALDQLRDELLRLGQKLGHEARLHRSRSGLASTYARNGQLNRAAAEWRAVIAAEPDNSRARMALAEVLWRQGEDTAAATIGRELLAQEPDTARALAILADIEHRRALPEAAATAARYRSLDPGGELLSDLRAGKPQANLEWLVPGPAMVPPFDFDAAAAPGVPVAVPVAVAAAVASVEVPVPAGSHAAMGTSQHVPVPPPDVWDTLVRDIGSGVEGVAPFAWSAEGEPAALEADPALEGVVPFDLGALADESEPADPYAALYAAAAPASEPVAAPDDPLAALIAAEPFAPPDAPEPPVPTIVDEVVPPPGPQAAAPEPFVTADGRIDLTVGWDDLDRALAEATPSDEVGGFDEIVAEFGADGIAPFDLQAEDGAADDGWAPFTEDDFAGWESGEAEPVAAADEAVDGSGEPALPEVPSETAEPTAALAEDLLWPEDASGGGFATEPEPAVAVSPSAGEAAALAAVVAGLAAGIDHLAGDSALPEADVAPFDVDAALTEMGTALPEMERAEPEMDAVAALTVGWDSIEEELAAAIPPSGLPVAEDGLDLLTDEGLVPFDFESHHESIDPLANPDAVGDPLDFDDLLLVTSQDATAPLGGGYGTGPEVGPASDASDRPADVDGAHLAVAAPDDLAGIVPFAFEEAVPVDAEAPIDFSDVEDVPPASTVDDFALFDEPIAEPAAEAAEAAEADEELDESPFDAGELAPEPPEFATEPAASGDIWDAVVEDDEAVAAAIAASPSAQSDEQPVAAPAPKADAGRSSRWPAFISGTSELVDRFGGVGVLFARLREEKVSLVDLGVLQIDRSLATRPAANGHAGADAEPAAARHDEDVLRALPLVAVAAGGTDLSRTRPAAADPEVAAEISRWRERLRLGRSEAEAVATEVEQRVAAGGSQTTYLRVLGEAYLKLGRSDLAAQQFRAASARRARRA